MGEGQAGGQGDGQDEREHRASIMRWGRNRGMR
jgi:hypothetical protein